MHLLEILFLLCAGHCVCDFSLQNDFMAQAKNPYTKVGKDMWRVVLPAHALVHALSVYLITQSLLLSVTEVVLHTVIDYLKCKGIITFYQDQSLHIACKLAYVAWLALA